jgi:HK97 gp10 family phage protein
MASQIKGLDKLQAKLKALPDAVVVEVRSALAGAAEEIVDMMKGLAPSDSGALRDSIGWTWGEAPKGSLTLGKLKSSRKGEGLKITIFAGNDKVWWGRWVEFGTASHIQGGKFAGSEHPGTRAQPFFFPAYRSNRKSAKAKVRKAVRTAAKKVAAS